MLYINYKLTLKILQFYIMNTQAKTLFQLALEKVVTAIYFKKSIQKSSQIRTLTPHKYFKCLSNILDLKIPCILQEKISKELIVPYEKNWGLFRRCSVIKSRSKYGTEDMSRGIYTKKNYKGLPQKKKNIIEKWLNTRYYMRLFYA